MHIGDGMNVDERADPGDEQCHHGGERVKPQAEQTKQ
jgi:hypothetical protein